MARPPRSTVACRASTGPTPVERGSTSGKILATSLGGQLVDVDGVLGDGEGDAVAGLVVELVAVGRAGREAEAAGEREVGAKGMGERGPEG